MFFVFILQILPEITIKSPFREFFASQRARVVISVASSGFYQHGNHLGPGHGVFLELFQAAKQVSL